MDKLYESAFRYKKTGIWRKVYDSELFAVKTLSGEMGYCSVMGRNGEVNAIAVYRGDPGLRSLVKILDDVDDFEDELHFSQDCVICTFLSSDEMEPDELNEARAYCNANGIKPRGSGFWPQFKLMEPRCLPKRLPDSGSRELMLDGMDAACELSRLIQSGEYTRESYMFVFPEDSVIPLFSRNADGSFTVSRLELKAPEAEKRESLRVSDIQAAKIKRAKKNYTKWGLEICCLRSPVEDAPGSGTAHFPTVQIVYSLDNDMILGITMSETKAVLHDSFMIALVDLIVDCGKPKEFVVMNDRAECAYRELAEVTGIKLTKDSKCFEMRRTIKAMLIDMVYDDELEEDDDDENEILRIIERASVVIDNADLMMLTDEELSILHDITEEFGDYFSKKQKMKLRAEIRRRGGLS